ncbi:ThiS family protein [Poriferisphaera corsica]|uniref:ThiS family protein n=1 Tax=Poriferisphaera corsica TaxID=2528020 RepID=A0A517YSM5_9BACT|nr:MoaD/ThiS family protein [Poriferisphaera corsica]QDU33243.1 ThiS family protein [Poriferisphaera corsica]
MKIDVRLFGPHVEAMGGEEILRIETNRREMRCEELIEMLAAKYPQIRDVLDTSRVAVNHQYALGNRVIHEGDEVGLVAMISGG